MRIAGLSLCFRDGGGAGVPLVFQHGIGGDDEQTFQVLEGTPEIRPVTLNFPGHGGSDLGEQDHLSIPDFADLLAEFIDRRFGRKVLLGGISMGASVALNLAVRRPDLVLGLVLARPGWSVDAAPANVAPLAEVGRLLDRHDAATARALFAETPTAGRLAAESPSSLASLLHFFDREPRRETAALLTHLAQGTPGVMRQEVERLAVPTLVVGIGTEAVHPLAIARALTAMMPAARLVVIPAKSADRIGYLRGFKTALDEFIAALQPGIFVDGPDRGF